MSSKPDNSTDLELRKRIGLALFGGKTLPMNWETDSRLPRLFALFQEHSTARVVEELNNLGFDKRLDDPILYCRGDITLTRAERINELESSLTKEADRGES